MSGKRVYLPRHYDSATKREESARLVGYTGDGRVILTDAGRALVSQPDMSHEDALALTRELLSAGCKAEEVADRAAGLHDWVALPMPDGRFRVHYRAHTAIFRAIVNGKRRRVRPVGVVAVPIFVKGGAPPPLTTGTGHRCTICRREAPEGATMYVLDESTIDRTKAHDDATSLRGHRVCEPCTRPDLHAAVTGLSLLAGETAGKL